MVYVKVLLWHKRLTLLNKQNLMGKKQRLRSLLKIAVNIIIVYTYEINF